jgi:DNA-binding transcriptional LysR family regulator
LAESGAEIAGPLRIGASTLFAPAYIVPVAATFLERHSAITIELVLSDDYVDPIGSGVDLAIRIGDLPDSSLVARRLTSFRRVVFAAPGYLAKHGRPEKPADLKRHRCILRTAA